MFKGFDRRFAGHGWEVVKKLVQSLSALQIVEKRGTGTRVPLKIGTPPSTSLSRTITLSEPITLLRNDQQLSLLRRSNANQLSDRLRDLLVKSFGKYPVTPVPPGGKAFPQTCRRCSAARFARPFAYPPLASVEKTLRTPL